MFSYERSSHRRGQVCGLWWSDLVVLNATTPRSSDDVAEINTSSHHDIVAGMRRCLMELKAQYMSEDGLSVNYVEMGSSDKFKQYVSTAYTLRLLDVASLSDDERKTFFVNVYNSLVVHALIEGFVKSGDSFIKRMKMYATASYNIGGQMYSLNDIENGVLRGNRRSVTPLSSIPFSTNDIRLRSVVPLDPRIHFALNCGAKSCPPILVYTAPKINSQLDRAVQGALRSCEVDSAERSVTVSMLFNWYAADFGSSDSAVLGWIVEKAPAAVQQAILALQNNPGPAPVLKYHPYNWEINS